MIGNPTPEETEKLKTMPSITGYREHPVENLTPKAIEVATDIGLGTVFGDDIKNILTDKINPFEKEFDITPDLKAIGIGGIQGAIGMGEAIAGAASGLTQLGIEQIAIKQFVEGQNNELRQKQAVGLDLDKTEIDPDEYIANFRKSLKEMDMTKHFVDDKGVFNIDDRVHEWRKQTFGGDIVELGKKNPLTYAGAIVGGLGAGAAVGAVPVVGPLFSGEAYMGGIAKALGPLGKTLLKTLP